MALNLGEDRGQAFADLWEARHPRQAELLGLASCLCEFSQTSMFSRQIESTNVLFLSSHFTHIVCSLTFAKANASIFQTGSFVHNFSKSRRSTAPFFFSSGGTCTFFEVFSWRARSKRGVSAAWGLVSPAAYALAGWAAKVRRWGADRQKIK